MRHNIINQTLYPLSRIEKREFYNIQLKLIIKIILDLVSIASLLPLTLAYFDPSSFGKTKIGELLQSTLGTDIEPTTSLLIIIFSFFLVKSFYSYKLEATKSAFLTKIRHRLSIQVFQHNQKTKHLNKSANTGDILDGIIQIPIKYTFQCLGVLLKIIPNALTALLILIGLIAFQFGTFLLITIILMPLCLVYFLLLKRSSRQIEKSIKIDNPDLIQRVSESINGQLEIIIGGKQSFFRDRVNESSNRLRASAKRLIVLTNSAPQILELITVLSIMIFLIYLNYLNLNTEQSVFQVSIFVLSVLKLIPSLNVVVSSFTNYRSHRYTITFLSNIIQKEAKVKDKNEKEASIEFKDSIQFNDVSCAFEGSEFKMPVTSFVIKKNERLAILGKSGVGKSSLIKLLLKVLPSSTGEILIDGKNLEDIDNQLWWNQIAYVPQSAFVFKGTLLDNICIDEPQNTALREEITSLLIKLELDDLLTQLPNGLDSQIEENAANLSTGQRQRIGIARAIWQDRPIMIFDEVTSNLDEASKQKVTQVLLGLDANEKTLIFVTHDQLLATSCSKKITIEKNGN